MVREVRRRLNSRRRNQVAGGAHSPGHYLWAEDSSGSGKVVIGSASYHVP